MTVLVCVAGIVKVVSVKIVVGGALEGVDTIVVGTTEITVVGYWTREV